MMDAMWWSESAEPAEYDIPSGTVRRMAIATLWVADGVPWTVDAPTGRCGEYIVIRGPARITVGGLHRLMVLGWLE